MKFPKNISFCILIITIFNNVYSQKFDYGVKFGLPISNIDYSNLVDTHIMPDKPYIWMHEFKPKVGFNLSLTGGYSISSKIHIGIEPGYIIKGAKFDQSSQKLDLHYFNLPLLVKYEIFNQARVYLGAEFSKLIKAELGSINLDDFYNEKMESSILIGAEYIITKNIILGLRMNNGLTKVSETKWMDEAGTLYGTVKENNYYTLLYTIYTF